jgi:hypothetical protein
MRDPWLAAKIAHHFPSPSLADYPSRLALVKFSLKAQDSRDQAPTSSLMRKISRGGESAIARLQTPERTTMGGAEVDGEEQSAQNNGEDASHGWRRFLEELLSKAKGRDGRGMPRLRLGGIGVWYWEPEAGHVGFMPSPTLKAAR